MEGVGCTEGSWSTTWEAGTQEDKCAYHWGKPARKSTSRRLGYSSAAFTTKKVNAYMVYAISCSEAAYILVES